MLLRNKFWLWGHPEGRYNNEYGNNKASRMTPMEGCLYLGVGNTFMVPVQWDVNERQYCKSFKTLKQVGWGYKLHEKDHCRFNKILDIAREFPNVKCIALDDFSDTIQAESEICYDEVKELQHLLDNNDVRKLDSWMVVYTKDIGVDKEYDTRLRPYYDLVDGVIMWTWEEKHVDLIPEKFEAFKKLTPNTRRMAGCYLYNFGEKKQATGEKVKWQLDWWRERLLNGEIEGVVLHTNTMADLDYEAYDVACEWMQKYGDEEIPD